MGVVYFTISITLYAEDVVSKVTYDAAEYFELKTPSNAEILQVDKEVLFNEMIPYDEIMVENSPIQELNSIDKKVKNEFAPADFNIDSYEKALALAKRDNKIIMLAIRATKCIYCDKMELGTLINDEVVSTLNRDFVTLHLNQDLEELPIGLQNGMTPNFVFISTNEDIIDMYPGVRSPKEFIGALEEILVKSK